MKLAACRKSKNVIKGKFSGSESNFDIKRTELL